MKQYEMLHEVYNMCDVTKILNSSIEEVETDDLDSYMKSCLQPEAVCEQIQPDNGSIIYEVDCAGLRSKYTFTEI